MPREIIDSVKTSVFTLYNELSWYPLLTLARRLARGLSAEMSILENTVKVADLIRQFIAHR